MFKNVVHSLGYAFAALLVVSTCLAAEQKQPEKPRAARSVHLSYPAPAGDIYYNEMIVQESVPGSYFMACGWNTGYFGIQQLGRGNQKVVLFSVWDPTTGDDPSKVADTDRVEVLYSGENVRIRRFGGEGTGGQSMADFDWKLGETNCFLVHSKVEGNKTAYTAYVKKKSDPNWRKLATFRTRTGGSPLKGYHSFVEDFRRDFDSVNDTRRAACQNGWVRTVEGKWVPLTSARFTASGAAWESKENIDAGVKDGRFYMATGGDIKATTKLQDTIKLPATPTEPPNLDSVLKN